VAGAGGVRSSPWLRPWCCSFADNEVTGSEVLAVTVEPSSCSDAPTTPPIWAAQVTIA
jgi:hypothetical protein